MASHSSWTRRRVLFLSVNALLLLALLTWASSVLLPFILAAVVAYVLTPLVSKLERRGMPSGAAVVLVYFVLFSLAYMVGSAALPRLADELGRLKDEIPQIAKQTSAELGPALEQRLAPLRELLRSTNPKLKTESKGLFQEVEVDGETTGWELTKPIDLVQVSPNHWQVRPVTPGDENQEWPDVIRRAVGQSAEYARRNLSELAGWVSAIVRTTSRAVFLFFMTLMCAAYLMITRVAVLAFLRELFPKPAQPSFDRLLTRLDIGLSGVVRGQLMICLVNGILTAIGFALLGLKYWPVLALIAACLSIIPIFGSIMSTVPAVAIALTQDVWTALWVLLWVLGIHQIEANFLNPKIIGVSAKLHPVLVVFALVLGEHHFKLWGALLAVPTLSICQTLFEHARAEWLSEDTPEVAAQIDTQKAPEA